MKLFPSFAIDHSMHQLQVNKIQNLKVFMSASFVLHSHSVLSADAEQRTCSQKHPLVLCVIRYHNSLPYNACHFCIFHKSYASASASVCFYIIHAHMHTYTHSLADGDCERPCSLATTFT